MAPVGGGGATMVGCRGEKPCEAHNTPEFLEEQRERREGHQSRQIDKESPWLHCSPRMGKGLNPWVSRRQGGEDVHRRLKGVGALRFGCSEGVGRW
jgi:hypothetical protein